MWRRQTSSGGKNTKSSTTSAMSSSYNDKDKDNASGTNRDNDTDEEIFRKRVAQILRYIASMQGSSSSGSGPPPISFVKPLLPNQNDDPYVAPFFQNTSSRGGLGSRPPLALADFHTPQPHLLRSGRLEDVEDDLDDLGASGQILFTIVDFQKLATLFTQANRVMTPQHTGGNSAAAIPQAALPFHFYTSQSSPKKSQSSSHFSATASRFLSSRSSKKQSTSASESNCWLRLTRYSTEPTTGGTAATATSPSSSSGMMTMEGHEAPPPGPYVLSYLQDWLGPRPHHSSNRRANEHDDDDDDDWHYYAQRLLQSPWDTLQRAPTTQSKRVQRWLRRYKRYWTNKHVRSILEPMYNHLFEWYHHKDTQGGGGSGSANDQLELIWGIGEAKMILSNPNDPRSTIMVDGPLLEVRVEVELARDGALLVRPKEHSGVSLNRHVIAALLTNQGEKARQLRQTVESLEASDLSPGEPSTYTPILKQMAVELASNGIFQSASKHSPKKLQALLENGQLVVTDAWCLYTSPRPSAVWARDALSFSERILRQPSSLSDNSSNAQLLPQALWALTHGPGALERFEDKTKNKSKSSSATSVFQSALGLFQSSSNNNNNNVVVKKQRPHFPLPTSDAQNRIADLLLQQEYPAVICEGPPGTGKTHTIANIVCAYLCQGKRVLVTSKGAPALSVLRERLPQCVQELCVDVSMSESTGMRQLQQTVERLANKVAWVNTEREIGRSVTLQENINELEEELRTIDIQLKANAKVKRELVQTKLGQEFVELALELVESVPWLIKTVVQWSPAQVNSLHDNLKELLLASDDPIQIVEGIEGIPSDAVISMAASNAGLALSYLKNASKEAFAAIPLLGSRMAEHCSTVKEEVEKIQIHGSTPNRKEDWYLAFQALKREKDIDVFCKDVLQGLVSRERWPRDSFIEVQKGKNRIKSSIVVTLSKTARLKKLSQDLGVTEMLSNALEMERLDKRRTAIATRIQALAEDLVAARVVAELSKNFSAEAQSALVKFAQVSGKAKFRKSSQVKKMTQRQRRKRQEYLDAFEKCVRYIPCWILTSTQISDYLPSECLFDLVVIDEASQSDVTVLPGMLRGKQWLIVGDGKQVSPTESFVAEEQIEMLKAALPDSPFEASMLPGHSFFDLCAQAYPKGRVILREHFRCAPEIISFSNREFYNDNLVPLRLPTSKERLKPSLMDVRLRNGSKTGKINEQECDEIVRRIKKYVDNCSLIKKRSIGVISLVGDEQSRLIRGRLLDRIGPHKYKLHNILVGEPPSFQGAERDIVFLSMVCSPGSVVTQSQLMHAQRVNVALSRARDRMVLVRSVDTNNIPNEQDVKFSVLDFFERAKHAGDRRTTEDDVEDPGREHQPGSSMFRTKAESLLVKLLQQGGYSTLSMGVVWDNAICVEDAETSSRAAIAVEATGESEVDWTAMLEQQKSIERVGWKCMRVDAISMLSDYKKQLKILDKFLESVNVHPRVVEEPVENIDVEVPLVEAIAAPINAVPEGVHPEDDVTDSDNEAIVISSDEESVVDVEDDRKPAALGPSPVKQDDVSEALGNGETANDYGNVVDLGFLQGAGSFMDEESSSRISPGKRKRPPKIKTDPAAFFGSDSDSESGDEEGPIKSPRKAARPSKAQASRPRERGAIDIDDLEEKQRAVVESTKRTFRHDDLSESSSSSGNERISVAAQSRASKGSKRRRRKLDQYSRDPRFRMKKSAVQDDISHAEYVEEVVPEPSLSLKQKEQQTDVNIEIEDDGYEEESNGVVEDESYQEDDYQEDDYEEDDV